MSKESDWQPTPGGVWDTFFSEAGFVNEEDVPCSEFLQVDTEDNFDVCEHCYYHRLDHKEKQ